MTVAHNPQLFSDTGLDSTKAPRSAHGHDAWPVRNSPVRSALQPQAPARKMVAGRTGDGFGHMETNTK
jgi:hypothetical protein